MPTDTHKPIIGLRIVLVLSIIGSGLSMLSMLSTGIMLPAISQNFDNGTLSLYGSNITLNGPTLAAVEMMLSYPQWFYFLLTALYALSLYGAIRMWNLHKTGFHAYTLAQLLLLIVPVLFLGKGQFAIGDAMMSLLFIAYYFFTLKTLGVFDNTDEEPSSEDSDN